MKDKERKDLIIKHTTTTTVLRKTVILVVISLLAIALILNSSSRSDVFAKPKLTRGPISCAPLINDDRIVRCCQTETDSAGLALTYCTFCDNTNPPSNCTPRTKPLREAPTPVPPKSPPSIITTEPSSVAPPNGSSPTVRGTIEQPPSTVKDNSNTTSPPSTSQRVFSPTGGCIPGGSTCSPCDPGLPGADCIRSGDWLPSCSAIGGGTNKLGPPDCINTAGGGGSEGGGTTSPNGGAVEQPPSSIAPPTSQTPTTDCTTNPDDPSCATKLKPKVDCNKNPDDPSCKPTELKPTVDCAKDPDDPLCKTAGITRDSKSK